MAERKKTNNDIQHATQKTNDSATRTSLKTGSEIRCSGRINNSYDFENDSNHIYLFLNHYY